jgi:hypothetical protein
MSALNLSSFIVPLKHDLINRQLEFALSTPHDVTEVSSKMLLIFVMLGYIIRHDWLLLRVSDSVWSVVSIFPHLLPKPEFLVK